jgi:hypothetical protein
MNKNESLSDTNAAREPELEARILAALKAPRRTEGVRKIAGGFGVNPGTVQRISGPFDGSGLGAAAWPTHPTGYRSEPYRDDAWARTSVSSAADSPQDRSPRIRPVPGILGIRVWPLVSAALGCTNFRVL